MEFILEKLKDKKIIAIIFLIFIVSIYLIFSYFHSSTLPHQEYTYRTLHMYYGLGFDVLIPMGLIFITLDSSLICLLMGVILILFRKQYNAKKIIYRLFIVIIIILQIFYLGSLADAYVLKSEMNKNIFAYIDFWLMWLPLFSVCYIPYIVVKGIDYLIDSYKNI